MGLPRSLESPGRLCPTGNGREPPPLQRVSCWDGCVISSTAFSGTGIMVRLLERDTELEAHLRLSYQLDQFLGSAPALADASQ